MRTRWLTGVLALAVSGAARADEAVSAADVAAMRAELNALRSEVTALRGEASQHWLNERRAEEVKALVREVLSDADTRASLADDGMTAGHNGRSFFLASSDGAFLMNIKGQVQIRYLASLRDDSEGAATDPDDDDETGFQIRRARLVFEGHIGSPKIEYGLQITANRDTIALEVEKAYAAYAFTDTFRVGVGRFKDNFLREESISDGRQLAVERSLLNNIFTTNYAEGVYAEWAATEMVRLFFSVNDGSRSGDPGGTSTGFLNTGNDFHNDSTDVALTARADFKLAGDWKQADDFSAWSGEALGVFAGAAVHYELAETGDDQASGTTGVTGPYDDFVTYTLDALADWRGLAVYAAFIGQHINAADGNANGDLDNFGALVQAGFMVIPDKIEPFARYEWIGIDDEVADDDLNIVTIGANYYLKKHAAKFTLDAMWVMDPVTNANVLGFSGGAGTGLTGIGVLADDADEEDQIVLRASFQLLF